MKKRSTRPAKVSDVLGRARRHVDEGTYLDTRHASQRKEERAIPLLEIIYVLKNGYHEKRKDEFKPEFNDWNYAIRGKTVDGRALRVAIAFVEPDMLVITAIDLDVR
ncbi:DUF4258 domain-containing protein [Myxococcota bacterium]